MKVFVLIIIALTRLLISHGQPSYIFKGIVVDKSGAPVSQCAVYEKGTEHSTITDTCGQFEFINYKQDISLWFSNSLFAPHEQRINLKKLDLRQPIIFKLSTNSSIKSQCKKEPPKGKVIKIRRAR